MCCTLLLLALVNISDSAAPYSRLGAFEAIPSELLELIFGSLDVRTLCTARLICTPFARTASGFLKSLVLSGDYLGSHPDTHLRNFPNVTRVTVSGLHNTHLQVLEHPNLRDAVTDLSVTCAARGADAPHQPHNAVRAGSLPPLPPLSRLTSLTVLSYALDQRYLFPLTLRELVLEEPVACTTADPLRRLTNLTSLRVAVLHERIRPFDGLTTLRTLERLEIKSSWSFIRTLGKFTTLTHLVWTPHVDPFHQYIEGQHPDLTPLTNLQKLVHLGIGPTFSGLAPEDLAGFGRLPSLKSLDVAMVRGYRGLRAAQVPRFDLTRLGLHCYYMEGPLMAKVKMEGLEDLTLRDASRLREDGAKALERATGLTHLELSDSSDAHAPTYDLLPILGLLSRLRALSLQATKLPPSVTCSRVAQLLPGLTRLWWIGGSVRSDDVAACATLEQLQDLRLLPDKLAPSGLSMTEAFMGLASRPQLTKLRMSEVLGIRADFLTDDVVVQINSPRHERGWPALDLTLTPVK